jgi:hypothetical protein
MSDDPNKQFFDGVAHKHAAYKHYPLPPLSFSGEHLHEVIEFMYQEGLVSERIRDMVTKFALAMTANTEIQDAQAIDSPPKSPRALSPGTKSLPGRG